MQAKNSLNCVAFDCGNSSVRVVLGQYDGKRIHMEVVHQVENREIEVQGIFYWDILHIFHELQKGLQMAYRKCGRIDSVGVCTWGIDFGLLNKQGQLLGNPMCYRNSLAAGVLSELDSNTRRFMFDQTGIHNDQINTIYQLLGYRRAFPETYDIADRLLLIPDLLVYLFTGEQRGEPTIASTTQYYNVTDNDYSQSVLQHWNLDPALLPPLVQNAELIGCLKRSIADELHINACPFICVPSHDTACAIAAIPASSEDFLYVSSGTWGLIGTELQKPIISDAVYEKGFANEGGAFSTTTFLKNSAGMFIIQRVRRELRAQGIDLSWDEIVSLGKQAEDASLVFNPNHPSLFNPPSMLEAIRKLLAQTGQKENCSHAEVIRAVYGSMALCYKAVTDDIAAITQKEYPTLHIVGGGAQNQFLNQLCADATGKQVIAGPYEATSLGNIGVQLIYHKAADHSLAAVRNILRDSIDSVAYSPQETLRASQYDTFLEVCSL
ncbi:MAG: rhamnulokinase [Christensenellales bacterium]|jgi:rhamnulokinase